MRIKKQIGVLVALSVGVALATGAVAIYATSTIAETMREHEPMHPLIEHMVDLTGLSSSWFRRPSPRIEEQWQLVMARLTGEVIPAIPTRGAFDETQQQALIKNLAAVDRDFQEAVERAEGEPGRLDQDPYLRIIGERIGQRLQQLVSDAFSVSDQTFQSVQKDARRNNIAVAVVVVVAVLFSLVFGFTAARRIGLRLTQSMSDVSSAAAQMAAAAEQQQRIALQQAASVSETTTTMDELASSARRSSEQANSSLQTLEDISSQAAEGHDRADQMIAQMERLQADVDTIAEQTRAAQEQAGQIDSVTMEVAEIATQTNLLALNAAVEAVRAGEHGKGFSVVADEIRKLADQSKSSAARIRELVAESQKRSQQTAHASESGRDTLRNAVEVVARSGETFKQVLAAFEGIAERIQQIALTSTQQTQAIDQAVEAMETINTGASETVAALKQTNGGIAQVRDIADRAQSML